MDGNGNRWATYVSCSHVARRFAGVPNRSARKQKPAFGGGNRSSSSSGDENSYLTFDTGVEMHSRIAFRLLECLCASGLVGFSSVSRFVILDH